MKFQIPGILQQKKKKNKYGGVKSTLKLLPEKDAYDCAF